MAPHPLSADTDDPGCARQEFAHGRLQSERLLCRLRPGFGIARRRRCCRRRLVTARRRARRGRRRRKGRRGGGGGGGGGGGRGRRGAGARHEEGAVARRGPRLRQLVRLHRAAVPPHPQQLIPAASTSNPPTHTYTHTHTAQTIRKRHGARRAYRRRATNTHTHTHSFESVYHSGHLEPCAGSPPPPTRSHSQSLIPDPKRAYASSKQSAEQPHAGVAAGGRKPNPP